VLVGPWTDQAAGISGEGVEACFRNNIFLAERGPVPLRVENPHTKLRFEDNLYWRDCSKVEIEWGQNAYTSLEEWRKETGEESLDGKPLGLFENPGLAVNKSAMRSTRSISVSSFRTFRPLPSSPAAKAGLNLRSRFGFEGAFHDFLGRRLPATGPWPLGAFAR
jgi:hypothetical protein